MFDVQCFRLGEGLASYGAGAGAGSLARRRLFSPSSLQLTGLNCAAAAAGAGAGREPLLRPLADSSDEGGYMQLVSARTPLIDTADSDRESCV